jgi:pSer/pThr/pTyr-binding forkhead associated (FHA) protein
MKCYKCNENIEDGIEFCSFCNAFLGSLKFEKGNDTDNSTLIFLNNNVTFLLRKDINEITIGRKDINVRPLIDLGPFDNGPFISRNHGFFYWKENNLFYIDNSKNGTYINDIRIIKDQEIKIENNDKIRFANIEGVVKLKNF